MTHTSNLSGVMSVHEANSTAQHLMDISTGYMLVANDIEVHATPTLIS
jgi:hypothetical protein